MFCWHFLSLFDLPHVSLPLISYDYLSNIRWNFSGVLTSFFQILSEALLVLAELVRRFEVLPDLEHEPELVARLTLRSRNGIRVRLRARS